MELPDDTMMLFSMVNMKLRDCYHSLDELCDDMDVDKELLVKKLKAAGFEYKSCFRSCTRDVPVCRLKKRLKVARLANRVL